MLRFGHNPHAEREKASQCCRLLPPFLHWRGRLALLPHPSPLSPPPAYCYSQEDEEEAGIFHRAERVSSFRNRNLRMPDNADMGGPINAKYEDGVLEISIAKKEQAAPSSKQVAIA